MVHPASGIGIGLSRREARRWSPNGPRQYICLAVMVLAAAVHLLPPPNIYMCTVSVRFGPLPGIGLDAIRLSLITSLTRTSMVLKQSYLVGRAVPLLMLSGSGTG